MLFGNQLPFSPAWHLKHLPQSPCLLEHIRIIIIIIIDDHIVPSGQWLCDSSRRSAFVSHLLCKSQRPDSSNSPPSPQLNPPQRPEGAPFGLNWGIDNDICGVTSSTVTTIMLFLHLQKTTENHTIILDVQYVKYPVYYGGFKVV